LVGQATKFVKSLSLGQTELIKRALAFSVSKNLSFNLSKLVLAIQKRGRLLRVWCIAISTENLFYLY